MGINEKPTPLEIIPSFPSTPTTPKKLKEEGKALILAQQQRLDSLRKFEKVEIASNTEGRIKEVILQRDGSWFDEAFISFMQSHPKVSITMVVPSNDNKEDFVKKMENANIPISRCRFIVMGENDTDISVWARDSYVMVKAPDGKNAVMEPRGRTRYPGLSDRNVADRIVATTGERLITSPLVFDGGDLRVSGENLFVGAITIIQNIPKGKLATPDNVQQVVEKFQKQFGKKVIVVGFTQEIDAQGNAGGYLAPLQTTAEKAEPVFHLDLYFTPLNNNTIAIGDPALTKKVLKSMGKSIFSKREAELSGKGTLAEGLKIMEALKRFKGSKGSLPNQRQLDQVASDMKAKGFNVIRVPYFQDGDYPMSYNNVLVENFKDGNEQVTQVSLPQYGIPELDKIAIKVYQKAGIKVIPIDGLLPGIYQMGALDCLTSEKRE